MALRRKLPSRATPDASPESAAAPENKPAPRQENNSPKPAQPPKSAAPQPSAEAPTTPKPVVQEEAFATAAMSAFSTLPDANAAANPPSTKPARVLEESFSTPAQVLPEPATIEPPVQIFEETPPLYVENLTVANVTVQAPAPESAPEPAPQPVSAPAPQLAPRPDSTPQPFSEPAVFEPINTSAFPPVDPIPTAPSPEPVTPTPAAAEPESGEQPSGPVTFDFQPSRPEGNAIKRRVREKRPRDFSAMGAPENQPAERIQPAVSFAPTVPVDTRPLDKVDEDLIATGIIEAPAADSLTSSLPSSSAETETAFAPLPPVAITPPAPAPRIEPKPEPAPLPAPLPTPLPVAAPPAPPAPTPAPLPQIAPANLTAPAPVAAPSFNLSNIPAPAAAPLPPPSSDLPWTQTPSTAEWELEPQTSNHWDSSNGAEAAPMAPHMPPPADLYKPLNTSPTTAAMGFGGTLAPRMGNNFTPELPGQRRKPSGTPWALIVVGGLVIVGAGAYYFYSGDGAQQAQQQLATLTGGAQQPPATGGNNALLPPPTEASFYTPNVTAVSGTDTSSTAVVNFADVTPDQANQPIVADGTETPPPDSGILAQFGNEVAKVRAAKHGEAVAADASSTAPAQAENVKQDIQQEIAAYRSALAQSPNPSTLTPSAFKKDPDNYMDGKTQTATAPTATGEGSPTGAILPPPTDTGSTSNGNLLPPPELYTNNPKNLPVVSEPVANAPARVRTLADFPDVEPYMPEKEKVEIPRNLKPKLAATDFPALEILSFVPGKGIVAFADGREGVLLIGESINGWELTEVTADNAAFKAGQKSYTVTAQN